MKMAQCIDFEKESKMWIEENQDTAGFFDLVDYAKHFFERGFEMNIEKACDWLKKHGGSYWMDDYDLPTDDLVNDFRNYMKEE